MWLSGALDPRTRPYINDTTVQYFLTQSTGQPERSIYTESLCSRTGVAGQPPADVITASFT